MVTFLVVLPPWEPTFSTLYTTSMPSITVPSKFPNSFNLSTHSINMGSHMQQFLVSNAWQHVRKPREMAMQKNFFTGI